MRTVLLFCGVLLVCSCAGKNFQNETVEKSVNKEASVLPSPVKIEPVKIEPVKELEPIEATESYQDYTFASIVLKEGIPFENIIPRSKEQVAIYKKKDFYIFYYLKNNKLVLKKNYSFQELDKIKAENKYPKKVLKDLGVI